MPNTASKSAKRPDKPVTVKLNKKSSALGTTSLVFAILALIGCWIPFLNLLSLPMAAISIIVGVIGILIALISRKVHANYAISGVIMSIVAVMVAYTVTVSTVVAMDDAIGTVSETVIEDL